MAMKPKKIMNVNRPENFGGSSRLSNEFGKAPKQFAVRPVKKAATAKNRPVTVKSGGDIKPASTKKTIASNPAGVGKYTKSSDSIKREMQGMMDMIQKGNKVKINTDPAKKGVFSPLKKKLAAANTPANRAKAAAAARALKAANKNR